MKNGPGIAELQRWSEEVARDPGSPSFLPLAEAYRKLGKTQAALRVCLRGLERSPGQVDAHLLLARLYLELGDRERAADEWAVTARLDPDNFDAHRGLGFFHLERGELSSAGRHLERAVMVRPGDPAVQEALSVLRRHQARSIAASRAYAGNGGTAGPAVAAAPRRAAAPPRRREADGERAAARAPEPPEAAPAGAGTPAAQDAAGPPAAGDPVAPAQASAGAAAPAVAPNGSEARLEPGERDPSRVFEPLSTEAPYMGALLLDPRGLVLAGSFRTDGIEHGETLGAVIGIATEEAARTAALLGIGAWRGILIETDRALLHIAPLEPNLVVLTAAARGTPMGWALRAAERASALARRFLEGGR